MGGISTDPASSKSTGDVLQAALRKVVASIAGIFSLSAIGIIGLPLTKLGAITSAILVVGLGVLYFRKARYRTTITVLVLAAPALVAVNCASLLFSDRVLYVVACTSVSPDCLFPHQFTAFGKPALAVPVVEPKLALYRYVLEGGTSAYFPRTAQYGSGHVIFAPLEDEAAEIFRDRDGAPSFHLYVQPTVALQIANVTVKSDDTLLMGGAVGFGMTVKLDSTLSRDSAGLFSTITAGDPGVGDWERAIFANELVRALYEVEPARLLKELQRESERTHDVEDFTRFATLSVIFDEAYYSGTTGIGQRTANIRRFIEHLAELKDEPGHPWNSAFIHAVLEACSEMETGRRVPWQTGVLLERYEATHGSPRPQPFAGVLSWASARLAEQSTITDEIHDVWLKHIADDIKGLSETDAARKLLDDMLDELTHPVGPEREAALVVEEEPLSYPARARSWLSNDSVSTKANRVQLLADAIANRNLVQIFNLYQTTMSGGSDSVPAAKQIDAGRAELKTLSEKLRFLDANAVNSLQKDILRHEAQTNESLRSMFDAMSTLLGTCVRTGPSETHCVLTALKPLFDAFGRSRVFMSVDAQDDATRNAQLVQAVRLALEVKSEPRSWEEFDQVLAAMLGASAAHHPRGLSDPDIATICTAADHFSEKLLSDLDRVILHNAAILLGAACKRGWEVRHRNILLRTGLTPDLWVEALLQNLGR